ncbi:DUF4129 domain-containing protein [Phycisphaerales bacterium AB-hyl4]|uniref:DUF4129 domain-containing protein n=1 Tax=Natronomicrosphaera hydrolytica TaxID=3242702 RepID=A0ABV4UAK2_9BACT
MRLAALLMMAIMLLGFASAKAGAEVDAAARGGPTDDPRAHLQQIKEDPLFTRWQRREMRAQGGERSELWFSQQWNDLRTWIGDALDRLFARQRARSWFGEGAGEGLGTLMRWFGVVLAGVLLLFVVLTVVRLLQERSAAEQATPVRRSRIRDALESGEALAAGGSEWMGEAERLAGEGDLRLAYRAVYLSLLSGLHERKKIDFRRHRTNWTYVRQYRGADRERSVLAELTATFDETWYGQHLPERSRYEQIRERVGMLISGEAADG